jgi:hypothetical protein
MYAARTRNPKRNNLTYRGGGPKRALKLRVRANGDGFLRSASLDAFPQGELVGTLAPARYSSGLQEHSGRRHCLARSTRLVLRAGSHRLDSSAREHSSIEIHLPGIGVRELADLQVDNNHRRWKRSRSTRYHSVADTEAFLARHKREIVAEFQKESFELGDERVFEKLEHEWIADLVVGSGPIYFGNR